MRRFAFLSILLHVLVAAGWATAKSTTELTMASDIHVSLSGNTARPVDRSRPKLKSVEIPVLTQVVSTASNRATSIETTERSQDRRPVISEFPTTESRITNDLLAQLHAAVHARFLYPPLARQQGWQGSVRLGLTIGTDGTLTDLRVLASSGYSILDQDAIQTVARIGALPPATVPLTGHRIHLQLPIEYRLIDI